MVAVAGFLPLALLLRLIVTGRDTGSTLRDFLRPLRILKRLRFGLRELLVAVTILAVAAKLASLHPWADRPWLENVLVAHFLLVAVPVVACLPWLMLADVFPRRRRSLSDVTIAPPADRRPERANRPKLRIRFPEQMRQLGVFKR